MRQPLYLVDAFADRPFTGNPAAVCPLDRWLPDALMQNIAMENNQAETAFFVRDRGGGFELRWFTPEVEMDLCGHATLAAAHVLFGALHFPDRQVTFASKSGPLTVRREGDLLELDFPSRPPQPCAVPDGLVEGLGATPVEVSASRDYFCVFESAAQVRALVPDFNALNRIDKFGVIVTAPGDDCDFVSRFFCPNAGVPEDPVTGSAHCTLIPYWAKRLGKSKLNARQLSRRGGTLRCEDRGERVRIAGRTATFMRGELELPG